MAAVKKARKIKSKKTKKIKTAAAIGNGWLSTDQEEIERRQLRAQEENLTVRRVRGISPAASDLYGGYLVSSSEGNQYRVELRAKDAHINSCTCPDFKINGLGTCKHIEKVLQHLKHKKTPTARRCTEVFVHPTEQSIQVLWADGLRKNSKVRTLLKPFFSQSEQQLKFTVKTFLQLQKNIQQMATMPAQLRLSSHILPRLEQQERKAESERARLAFLQDAKLGRPLPQVVKLPLYEYQRQGMLHLAFNERAILADEMGLGKTVQAIAASELLRQRNGVEKVLVVSPVSLKTEWQEQIEKFTARTSLLIQGGRAARLKLYQQPAFFYLANYEQLLYDYEDIQQRLQPDIIIFDEAQRVKNWQTKTAQVVKKLVSRYLFVLTGTPLENRIDEIYSIAQLVDPLIFGPLFRFNRDFYQLDEKGRPQGYKNLDTLHQRLKPILLRRRKADVEGELPERINNNYFVPMVKEQRKPYEEYESTVARLMRKGSKMPLKPEEYKVIQLSLACMRMLCDSPYILDQSCRISPKLDELKTLLSEQLEDPANKIIIFSEWVKMLELIQHYLDKNHIPYALHTGQVAQQKRRIEINRFKTDPACRIFLSSDAGATGLNLQIANVVVNMDLPWNPAKLEQRIARAWRKHQKRRVSVINLITEHSIEHRMLGILKHKTELADGVLEGKGEAEMALPSGRKVMIERLQQLIGNKEAPGSSNAERPPVAASHPLDTLKQLVTTAEPAAQVVHNSSQGNERLIAVVHEQKTRQRLEQAAAQHAAADQLEVIDAQGVALLKRLAEAGAIELKGPLQSLLETANSECDEHTRKRWQLLAGKQFSEAQRQLSMAELLFNGSFTSEAAGPIMRAVEAAVNALLTGTSGTAPDTVVMAELADETLATLAVPKAAEHLIKTLQSSDVTLTPDLITAAHGLFNHISERLSD